MVIKGACSVCWNSEKFAGELGVGPGFWREGFLMLIRRTITGCLVALVMCSCLLAVSNRGTIQGTVTDPQSAVIPGAEVLVRNDSTGVEVKLTTNSAGFYHALDLVPGQYTVHFKLAGFSDLVVSKVTVLAGNPTTADGKMQVGTTRQTIQVTATTPQIGTSSSNFTTFLGSQYINNIPLQGRDIQTLVQLMPGVVQSSGPSGSNFGFNSAYGGFPDPLHLVGSGISANGGQAGANIWLLDGALDATVGAESTVVNPSPDAVTEFNMVDNGLAAEYGPTSGGVVNVVLKSGTNSLHGDLYEYNRNSYFSATNPFARRSASGTPLLQPAVNYNDLGGTVGGPVTIPHLYNGKDRTFFFASYDLSLLHERVNRLLTVPPLKERQGNFTGDPRFSPNCGPSNPGITNCLYDPQTTTGPDANGYFHRTPFQGLVLPQDRLDSLAQFYMQSMPAPNYLDPLQQGADGCGIYCNNYIGAVGSSMTTHNVSLKMDHVISDKHKLFAAWLYNPSYYTNFRYPWNGPTAQTNTGVAGANPYNTSNQLAILGLTSTFTSTLVNEVRISYGRQNMVSLPNPESVTGNQEVQQRVQGLNFLLYEPFQPVPTISISNYAPSGYNGSFGPVEYQNGSMGQQSFNVTDNLTKIIGKHTLKMGGTYRLNNLWANYAYGFNIGTFDYSLTNDPYTYNGGDGLATFLLGAVPQGGANTAAVYAPWQTNKDYALYLQDEFRAARNLQISLGLRWDVFGWISERHDMLANFNLSEKNPIVNYMGAVDWMGTPQHPSHTLFPANKNSLGPRIGFAWAPGGSGKTVVRGSYGIVYSNSMSALFGQGNGAVSSPGSSAGVYSPVTDPYYMTPSFILHNGLSSPLALPDLSVYRKENQQYVGQAQNIFGFLKANHDPYVQQWSLFLEHQFPGGLSVSAGYVGSHGLHLLGEEITNTNHIPTKIQEQVRGHINDNIFPVDSSLSGMWDCGPNGAQTTCSGWYALAPYPQFWSLQPLLRPDGYNNYESGQLRVEKRYSNGLNFIASYTYSKNMVSQGLGALVANTAGPTTISNRGVGRIAYIPGAAGGGAADGNQHVWSSDPDNRALYYALAPDDTPHVFNIAATYELPFGKGKHFATNGRFSNAFFGGWKLTQNWNFQSGVPMYFTSSACNLLYGAHNSCLPDLVGDLSAGRSSKSRAQKENQWWNPNALAPPFGTDPTLLSEYTTGVDASGNPVDYNAIDQFWKFGNSGLRPPSGRVPGFWNADFSLGKDFHFAEQRSLSFRWDVFNALNHQNLGVPSSWWCQPPYADGSTDATHVFGCQFGKITTIQTDPRAMQFSLKFMW